ncbi:predicted GPI-anchored protein 58 [Suricata suricatta]|uniref:predicted GPI-anchored protein 58 n=1 Tax=Suricata suricatta TaxID=37032 RepID=UPI001155343B|nr:predicted GPI-anchored protein 58 [Suricata suricatta]XP_029774306.1 predicted GPI-anchored protein 58 [Suricata suricatta]
MKPYRYCYRVTRPRTLSYKGLSAASPSLSDPSEARAPASGQRPAGSGGPASVPSVPSPGPEARAARVPSSSQLGSGPAPARGFPAQHSETSPVDERLGAGWGGGRTRPP